VKIVTIRRAKKVVMTRICCLENMKNQPLATKNRKKYARRIFAKFVTIQHARKVDIMNICCLENMKNQPLATKNRKKYAQNIHVKIAIKYIKTNQDYGDIKRFVML